MEIDMSLIYIARARFIPLPRAPLLLLKFLLCTLPRASALKADWKKDFWTFRGDRKMTRSGTSPEYTPYRE